jgi:hypothetical protein
MNLKFHFFNNIGVHGKSNKKLVIMEKAPRGYMRTFSMLSRLLKRVHMLIFGFLLIFSDLFSILIVLFTLSNARRFYSSGGECCHSMGSSDYLPMHLVNSSSGNAPRCAILYYFTLSNARRFYLSGRECCHSMSYEDFKGKRSIYFWDSLVKWSIPRLFSICLYLTVVKPFIAVVGTHLFGTSDN